MGVRLGQGRRGTFLRGISNCFLGLEIAARLDCNDKSEARLGVSPVSSELASHVRLAVQLLLLRPVLVLLRGVKSLHFLQCRKLRITFQIHAIIERSIYFDTDRSLNCRLWGIDIE